ncbi:lytic polysaccharide monooxygenase [Micromonospora sp. S4605]|uniref:lytic polysaccharide monooxygenase n=1 Tax=Micromonospora sp. S4605 TaxID=1420897 RepID=UPI003159080C
MRGPRAAWRESPSLRIPLGRRGCQTGHHIVFVIWQASHLDQAYMWCSDVDFV